MSAVSILGFGLMGRELTALFLRSGWTVTAWNRDAARFSGLKKVLAKPRDEGRLTLTTRLEDLAGSTLVIETIAENLEAKRGLLTRVEPLLPSETPILTNTSSLLISELAQALARPERLAGLHFVNPPQLMPLVEVVRGPKSSPAAVAAALETARRLGKETIEIPESPGFVLNRLLMPMVNEAALMLESGALDAAALDRALTSAFRWPVGPLAAADWAGLDVCLDIIGYLNAKGLCKAPAPLLRRLVAEGRLGRKCGAGFHDYSARE